MNVGGGAAASIEKYKTRYVYSSQVPFVKQELVVSKTVLSQWIIYANAYKTVTKNMSYTQVLLKDSTVVANNITERVWGANVGHSCL